MTTLELTSRLERTEMDIPPVDLTLLPSLMVEPRLSTTMLLMLTVDMLLMLLTLERLDMMLPLPTSLPLSTRPLPYTRLPLSTKLPLSTELLPSTSLVKI